MRIVHSHHHWLFVALVAGAALLTVTHAYGQHNDASAMFEGRPALAGAQAGTGAMAGPPQGGIGVQGDENTGIAVHAPRGLRDMPQGKVDPAADAVAVNRAVRTGRDVVPKDRSIAADQRSASRKAKRAAKAVRKQARHGVATIQ
jgi:hypothetical protein